LRLQARGARARSADLVADGGEGYLRLYAEPESCDLIFVTTRAITLAVDQSADDSERRARHFVILIHGTWGQDAGGWYQTSASTETFATRLAERLVGTPLEGALSRVTMFEWSGANTHEARMKAARDLALLLIRIRWQFPTDRLRFYFVAHSHGGNVLLAALPWYLTMLPLSTLNHLGFPKVVRDDQTTEQFFAAVGRLYALKHDSELHRQMMPWYRDVDQARWRYMTGRLTPGERYKLNLKMLGLAEALQRFSAWPDEHGIASMVFLGTPFYYKRWRSDWRHRMLNRTWNAVGEALVAGVAAYALLLATGGLLALSPAISWMGFSPFAWPLLGKSMAGLSIAWGALAGWQRVSGSANTNVYFDETLFSRIPPLADFKDRTIFDALVISSGYLDEAFSGLSSLPLIGTLATRLVDSMLKPKAWAFVPLPWEIGTIRMTVGGRVRRLIRMLGRRLSAGVKFLAYPLRLAIYTLLTRPLVLKQATRLALPLSYGLPSEEFLAGSIEVRRELSVPQIKSRNLDVAKDLLTVHANPKIDKERFEFLWDERILTERFATSTAAAQFHREPTAEVKRHALAIEERLREFFGVAGLRHSLYYENDAVLEAVAAYLLRREASGPSAGAPSIHLPSLGAT
jgi:hypothetical protein